MSYKCINTFFIMKKEINIIKIDLIVCLLIILAALLLFGCKTKKSTTDFKQTEVENVSVVDNSTVSKNQTVQENNKETSTETVTDKSFFETWMSFESDKITITDNQGNKTEITNPRINKKSSQSKDVNQSNQIAIKKEKSATAEENQQNNVAAANNRQIKTDLQQSNSSKGKEPVWLYVIFGAVIVLCVVIFLNKIFKKSN